MYCVQGAGKSVLLGQLAGECSVMFHAKQSCTLRAWLLAVPAVDWLRQLPRSSFLQAASSCSSHTSSMWSVTARANHSSFPALRVALLVLRV
jgi:hypothetical protein